MGWKVVLDMVSLLGVAFLAGLVMERLRTSAVLGYVLAGIIMGPGALGVVEDGPAVQSIAELGVALLLFTIGLEFSWGHLRRFGRVALGGGIAQMSLTFFAAAGMGWAFGLNGKQAFALGAIVALSSTAVVVRVLKDRLQLESLYGRNSLAILLLQDASLLPIMLAITFIGRPAGLEGGSTVAALGAAVLKLVAGGLLFYVVFTKLLPKFYDSRTVARNRELPVLLAIVTCIGAAWGAHEVGVSPSLGAFLAGMLLAGTPFAEQIRADVGPLKAVFVTLFFTSVGMLADVGWMWNHMGWAIAMAVCIIVGKTTLTYMALRLFKQSILSSLSTGLALAQIGEFSFVILLIVSTQKLFDANIIQLLTTGAVLTLIITPTLVVGAPRLSRALAKRLVPTKRLIGDEKAHSSVPLSDHIVLVGFGESGQAASQPLIEAGLELLVLEANPKLVATAKMNGLAARMGDATVFEILQWANIDRARGMAISIPDHEASRLIILSAKRLNPNLLVSARARYRADVRELLAAGADFVIDESNLTGGRLGRSLVVVGMTDGVSLS